MTAPPQPIRKGYVDTPWGQVHYREAGSAAGLPIVMFHQTASSSSMFEPLMIELMDSYRLIALDTPGFGGSFDAEQKGSLPFYSEVLRAALEGLGIRECWMFGHHTGASIAVQVECDQRGLAHRMALSGPTWGTDQLFSLIKERAKPLEIREDGSHMLQVWQGIRAKDPKASLEWAREESVNTLRAGTRWYEAYLAVADQPFNEQLSTLTCPTLMMAGENDSLRAGLEPAHAALPGSIMKAIPGATTFICIREAPLVAGFLREFFQ